MQNCIKSNIDKIDNKILGKYERDFYLKIKDTVMCRPAIKNKQLTLEKLYYDKRTIFSRDLLDGAIEKENYDIPEYLINRSSEWKDVFNILENGINRSEIREYLKKNNYDKQLPLDIDPVNFLQINGDAGIGKSSLIYGIYQYLFSERNVNKYVPLFIDLSTSTDLKNFYEGFYDKNEINPYMERLIDKLHEINQSGGKPLIIVEGLDVPIKYYKTIKKNINGKMIEEIVEYNDKRIIIDSLNSLIDKSLCTDKEIPDTKIITIGRKNESEYLIKNAADYAVDLMPLDEDQLNGMLEVYIRKYYSEGKYTEDDIQEIISEINQKSELHELMSNPLIMNMIFASYTPNDLREIKSISRSKVFENYWTEVVETRYDGNGNRIKDELGKGKGEVLKKIAYELVISGNVEIKYDDVNKDYIEELKKDNIILRDKNIIFHDSLLTYAAARYVIDDFKGEDRTKEINKLILSLYSDKETNTSKKETLVALLLMLSDDESILFLKYFIGENQGVFILGKEDGIETKLRMPDQLSLEIVSNVISGIGRALSKDEKKIIESSYDFIKSNLLDDINKMNGSIISYLFDKDPMYYCDHIQDNSEKILEKYLVYYENDQEEDDDLFDGLNQVFTIPRIVSKISKEHNVLIEVYYEYLCSPDTKAKMIPVIAIVLGELFKGLKEDKDNIILEYSKDIFEKVNNEKIDYYMIIALANIISDEGTYHQELMDKYISYYEGLEDISYVGVDLMYKLARGVRDNHEQLINKYFEKLRTPNINKYMVNLYTEVIRGLAEAGRISRGIWIIRYLDYIDDLDPGEELFGLYRIFGELFSVLASELKQGNFDIASNCIVRLLEDQLNNQDKMLLLVTIINNLELDVQDKEYLFEKIDEYLEVIFRDNIDNAKLLDMAFPFSILIANFRFVPQSIMEKYFFYCFKKDLSINLYIFISAVIYGMLCYKEEDVDVIVKKCLECLQKKDGYSRYFEDLIVSVFPYIKSSKSDIVDEVINIMCNYNNHEYTTTAMLSIIDRIEYKLSFEQQSRIINEVYLTDLIKKQQSGLTYGLLCKKVDLSENKISVINQVSFDMDVQEKDLLSIRRVDNYIRSSITEKLSQTGYSQELLEKIIDANKNKVFFKDERFYINNPESKEANIIKMYNLITKTGYDPTEQDIKNITSNPKVDSYNGFSDKECLEEMYDDVVQNLDVIADLREYLSEYITKYAVNQSDPNRFKDAIEVLHNIIPDNHPLHLFFQAMLKYHLADWDNILKYGRDIAGVLTQGMSDKEIIKEFGLILQK